MEMLLLISTCLAMFGFIFLCSKDDYNQFIQFQYKILFFLQFQISTFNQQIFNFHSLIAFSNLLLEISMLIKG
jgi:hypothetical protein